MKRITLLKPHTHAGTAHPSGVTLPLPDHVADWLIERGIGVVATRLARAVTVPAPQAEPPLDPAQTAAPDTSLELTGADHDAGR